MASESGVLYIGITNDLDRRVFEHQHKRVPDFSARYNVRKLVYFELYGNVRAAIAREKELKGWVRKKKIKLTESRNPTWRDLSTKARSVPRNEGERPASNVRSAVPIGRPT